MVDALYDQEQRQHKAVIVYVFNRYNLFTIAWLKLFASAISIYMCYYYIAVDNFHYEAYFVEVVKVLFLDRILRIYIGY